MAVVTGLLNEYTAATGDQNFLHKVEIAVFNAAQAIAAEATNTSDHANRVALCKAVTQPGAGPGYAEAFAKLICAQGIDTAVDSAIQNMVNATWNAVAGAL